MGAKKIPMTREKLQEKLDNIRGAVTMAYPMGLPDWDIVKMTIDGIEGLDGTSAGNEALNGETAELWVATKFFDRSQTVGDRLGRNEKPKLSRRCNHLVRVHQLESQVFQKLRSPL